MLENYLDMHTSTNTSNWVGDNCQESYGLRDVWTDGAVNETFFSPYKKKKKKMTDRFQEEWRIKHSIATDLPPTVYSSQFTEQKKYLNDITIKKFREALVRLRLGIRGKKVNIRYEKHGIFFVKASWRMKLISGSTASSTQPSDKTTLRSLLTRKYHLF